MPALTTIFTAKPANNTVLLYSATDWVQVSVIKTSTGPVILGTNATLSPTVSASGILLPGDVQITFGAAPGTQLYVGSDTAQEVSAVVTPAPWLTLLLGTLPFLSKAIGGAAAPSASGGDPYEAYMRELQRALKAG